MIYPMSKDQVQLKGYSTKEDPITLYLVSSPIKSSLNNKKGNLADPAYKCIHEN